MIDMNFVEFLTLLVLSLIAALIVHYGIGYRYFKHADGFFWKWIFAWSFAWISSPVLGHWFVHLRIENVYLIPALLGGFIGAFMATAIWKGIATSQHSLPASPQP
jgi:hypothetical protein